jgi:hypothetical protein
VVNEENNRSARLAALGREEFLQLLTVFARNCLFCFLFLCPMISSTSPDSTGVTYKARVIPKAEFRDTLQTQLQHGKLENGDAARILNPTIGSTSRLAEHAGPLMACQVDAALLTRRRSDNKGAN